MPQHESSIGEQSNLVETQDLLNRALSGVSPTERQLLWLAYAEEASHREIAGMLGYRENSVRPLLHKAKHRVLSVARKFLGGA